MAIHRTKIEKNDLQGRCGGRSEAFAALEPKSLKVAGGGEAKELAPAGRDHIHRRIDEDVAAGKNGGRVITRFPPEPNGYLHIGHAKAICLNFGIAEEYQGICRLRLDDTNPGNADDEMARAIERDLRWLGYSWEGEVRHASDYFDFLCGCALSLIKAGKAYVDSSAGDTIRSERGTLTEPGRNSRCRNRGLGENLELFSSMQEGRFPAGSQVLRARIDMASPNLNMRDPVLYRIVDSSHMRTGKKWHIYPTYDFAQGLSDACEGVTHSLCTLEFEDHRLLYDWLLEAVATANRPQQLEYARLAIEHTVLSKRLLAKLVDGGHVSGWDDPRLPTLSGLRRRGYTAAAIRDFCSRLGITRKVSLIQMSLLEECLRLNLDPRVERRLAVLDPIKLILTNWPEDKGQSLSLDLPNHPKDPGLGRRQVIFSPQLYIEREDFSLDPPPGFKRLALGGEVRLRGAYVIRAVEVKRGPDGEVTEIYGECDWRTLGQQPKGRKVKGVIHWVSAQGEPFEARLYDRLLLDAQAPEDLIAGLNPDALKLFPAARIEASSAMSQFGQVKADETKTLFQFERLGYFCLDRDSGSGEPLFNGQGLPVFNRVVTLRDRWGQAQKTG